MNYKKIVCGVTGSLHSQKAALEAAKMAAESSADLIYVYAVDVSFLNMGSGYITSGVVAESLNRLGEQFLDFAGELAKVQGVTARKILKKGLVLEVLIQVVQEEKADLLVLGHEPRTFIEKAILKGDVEEHLDELISQTGVEIRVIR